MNTSKEKKKINSYLVQASVLIVVLISILISFGLKMMDSAKVRVEEDYMLELSSVSTLYEKELYSLDKSMALLASDLFSDDVFSEVNIEDIHKAASILKLENVYIVDTEFNAIDISGKEYSAINEKEEFRACFDSKNKNKLFYKNENGKNVVFISKPIATSTSLKGYVIGEYSPSILDTLLDNPRYSSKKVYALLTSDGQVIERTGRNTDFVVGNEKITDQIEKAEFIDGSQVLLRQAILGCKSICQQIVYDGVGYYVYCSPIKYCKATVIMLADREDVERTYSEVSKETRLMLIRIGVAVAAFLAVFIGISLFNRARYNIENENLKSKADTDQLTELYNKMATERMIKEYLQGEGKDGVSVLFVLDIDNFKKINDTMGHAFGDRVISQFGHQIRAWFRMNDIVGRIGGDEFMILVKDVKDLEVVTREGSRIMQFFEGFQVGDYTKYSPTASVGGAIYPNDAQDFESLYKAADKAVYKSKKEGKNRVSFYNDLNVLEKEIEISKEN